MTHPGTCVLTGATRGLGRAVTIALVRAGYDVLAMARSRADLDQLAGECPGPGTVVPLAVDLGDGAAVEAAARQLAALEQAPKALINNAAAQTFHPVEDFTTEEFASVVYVNTVAPFALSRAVLPAMIAAGGGLIVNVASDLAYRPHVNGAAYCASKAGLVAWSQVLQEEQRDNGIKVSVVEPGWIATGEAASSRAERGDMDPDQLAEAIVALLRLPDGIRVDRLVIHPMNQGTWG
jgi:short-subunit dehydrogenase